MAKLIDGKAIAGELRKKIKADVDALHQTPTEKFTPGLAIIQVGDRSDSNVYIKHKLRAAEECGIKATHYKLSPEITQLELEKTIDELNDDDNTDGMIVQLPLDTTSKIDTDHVIDRIHADKDVDGLTRVNAGKLSRGELDTAIVPCTPRGCLHLVESTGVSVKGKRVVVLGRSKIVGKPAADVFMWNHATVTTCHSRTENLADICRTADILIVAIGRAHMVKGDWIKPGAVVIDCGINVLEGQGPNGKNKMVGDVDTEAAKAVAGHVTPVPGGVGPMTVAMLLKNTLDHGIKRRAKSLKKHGWSLSVLPLHLQTPVPSDIAVSRSQIPKRIEDLAEEIGIHHGELDLYGQTKAKVSLQVLKRLADDVSGKYVVVTGITPTPLGEGKSTTTIGTGWLERGDQELSNEPSLASVT